MRAAQLAEWEALGRQAEKDRLRYEEDKVSREEQEEREREEALQAEQRRQQEAERRRKQEEEEIEARRLRQLKEQEEAARLTAERRQLKDTTARPSTATSPRFQDMFKRRAADDSRSNPVSPPTTAGSRPKTSHASASKPEETIRPGGGGVVPLADAPISAVNHGERRVMVECGKSRIRLPVDPTTTPAQLLRSASTVLSESINPRAAVLCEVFLKANVQRKLRMYEHVRDVMNSWDNDDQHTLVIINSELDSDPELYSHNAPKSEPMGGTWEMYYSNKRGKWDKRIVTLRQDGQMLQSKAGKKNSEVSMCHLSDYDIYDPIPRLVEKKIKPPKKYCYGVKSQQKSGIFMTSTNFIHMFSTSDSRAAESFYSAVQAWRSWYLVDVMGEGGNGKKVNTNFFSDDLATNPSDTQKKADGEKAHGRTQSADSHYLLGSFNDLGIDSSQFRYSSGRISQEVDQSKLARTQSRRGREETSEDEDRPLGLDFPVSMISRGNKTTVFAMHARKLSQRAEAKRSPPISYPAHMMKPSEEASAASQDTGEDFAAGGLLGGAYDRRKEAASSGLKRSSSTRTSRTTRSHQRGASSADGAGSSGSGLARRDSTRARIPDRPLVDLTPQYKEAPQHVRKGRAVRPGAGSALIDAVPENANLDDAIRIPPSTTWKRPATSAGAAAADAPTAAGPSRYKQRGSPPGAERGVPSARHRPTAAAADAQAFTGDGLLAKSKAGWGAGGRGHGVMRGSEAKGPMVDLNEQSAFAEGSLLRRAEKRGVWS